MKEKSSNILHKDLVTLTRVGYDRIAKDFSGTRMNFWKELTEIVVSRIQPGDRLLDLGCGNARFYRETPANKGVTYIGCDFSEGLIMQAKKFHPDIDLSVCDVRSTPYADGSFNIVVSFAVLHHLSGNDAHLDFFREVDRLLMSGGTAIITVWNIWKTKKKTIISQYLQQKLKNPSWKLGGVILPFTHHDAARYVYGFKKNELQTLVKKSGLEIESIQNIHRASKKGNEENIVLILRKK